MAPLCYIIEDVLGHFPSFLDFESSDKNNHFFGFVSCSEPRCMVKSNVYRVPSYGKTLDSASSVRADSVLQGMLGPVYR